MEASKDALKLIKLLQEKKFTERLSPTERGTVAAAVEGLERALKSAESGQKAATDLLQSSEQLANQAVQAQRTIGAPELLAVLQGHTRPITALTFSAGTATPGFLATAGADNSVRLWTRDGEKVNEVKAGVRDGVQAVAFSPDGAQLAIATMGAAGPIIHVRHLAHGDRYDYPGHSGPITSVSFGPDGLHLLSSSGDRTVQMWRVDTGLERKWGPFPSVVTSAVFDPTAEHVLASLDDAARLWSLKGDAVPLELKMKAAVKRAVFSANGKLALTAGSEDKTAALWDAASGALLHLLEGHSGAVNQAVFNPAGDLVATASADMTVRVWSVSDGRAIRTLSGHTGAVQQVAFSPDGQLLLTGSDDHTGQLWSVTDKTARYSLEGHTGPLTAIAFSADGTHLATGSTDGMVRLWEITAQQLSAAATGQSNWILYGYLDRTEPDKFRLRSFSRTTDKPAALPSPGDVVKAEAHMNIRESVTLRDNRKWDQGKTIGLLRKDTVVKVLEVRGLEVRGEPPMVWIRIDPSAGP